MSLQEIRPDMINGIGSQAVEEYNTERQYRTKNEKCEQRAQNTNICPNENYKQRRKKRRRYKRQKERKDKNQHDLPKKNGPQQYDDEGKTWGDEIEIDKRWMTETQHDRLRIMHLNTNGITSKQEYVEWEVLLDSLNDYQTENFCLNETKLDTRQSKVQYELKERAKHQDKHLYLTMNSSKQPPATSQSSFKPGGTLMGIRGNWSGRIIHLQNDPTKDTLGRWTTMHLKGKNDTIITIMSVYQVCQGGELGDNTAYIQQQTDLFHARGRYLDPRTTMCKDLKKVLKSLNEREHKIIICADINDNVGSEFKTQWNSIMEEAGMRHGIQTMHGNRPLPRTYDRGIRCLDTIMLSENIKDDNILVSGILPFYSVNASDHRALYIDLNAKTLFEDTTPDLTKHTYRQFTTKNVKKSEIYLNTLTNYMGEAQLFRKVNEAKQDIKEFQKELKESGAYIGAETEQQLQKKKLLQHRIETLDNKRCQLMLAAEKKCGCKKNKSMFWYSTALRQAAQNLSETEKWLRFLYTQTGVKEDIEKAKQRKSAAIIKLREVQ